MLSKILSPLRSQGLVQECDFAGRAENFYETIKADLSRLVHPRFMKNRRLDRASLLEMADQIDSSLKSNSIVIHSRITEIGATLARKKGELAELRYVVVHAVSRSTYQLFSYRFRMTRKSFRMETRHLPVRFTHHAAERLIERLDDQNAALKQIGQVLLDQVVFSRLVMDTAICDLGFHMPLPASDIGGMLLGGFHSMDWEDKGYEIKGGLAKHLSGISSFWEPGVMYTAITFIDFSRMKPDQHELAYKVENWIDSRRNEYDALVRATCWPEHLSPVEEDVDITENLMGALENEANSIVRLKKYQKTIYHKDRFSCDVELSSPYQGGRGQFLDRMYSSP
jgi:hypothetical protein